MSVCSSNLCEGTEGESSGLTVSFFLPSVEELRPQCVCVCVGGVTLHWLTRNEGVSNSRVNTEGTTLIYDIVTVCINHVHTDYNKVELMMCHSSHLGSVSACNSSIICFGTTGLGVYPVYPVPR